MDLAGRPIDASATYPGGVAGDGLVGLKDFIRGYRQDYFLGNLCRKLMAYALNRSPQLSDESLVDNMKTNLPADGYKFRSMVDTDRFSQFRSKAFSRRVILKGAGCSLALPWLASVNAFADIPAAADFPKRFAVMFLGCGVNENHWSAEGSGADMQLSKTLSPLEPVKQDRNGLSRSGVSDDSAHGWIIGEA